MYEPAHDDEQTGLVRYLDQQLAAIRAAAVGLTDAQARARPCRSELSIGGILKHVTQGMRNGTERLRTGTTRTELDEAAFAAYLSGFTLTDDETAAGVLADFDAARGPYLEAVAATDPSSATTEPPAPWVGIFDARPANARYYLVHQIEEMARHAGHADIIREELDGMAVPAIVLSQEGGQENGFFSPYVPAAGTLGAAQLV